MGAGEGRKGVKKGLRRGAQGGWRPSPGQAHRWAGGQGSGGWGEEGKASTGNGGGARGQAPKPGQAHLGVGWGAGAKDKVLGVLGEGTS